VEDESKKSGQKAMRRESRGGKACQWFHVVVTATLLTLTKAMVVQSTLS